MNLAISNLAWDKEEQNEMFDFLKKNGINTIESIFTKIDEWENLNNKSIHEYKKNLDAKNINISSFQSIFYKTICNDINNESQIIEHFKKIIFFAEKLSAKVLVFGSPNLRKLNDSKSDNIDRIFKKLDETISDSSIKICIEPNSKIYGGHFFYNLEEIVNFIKNNELKNIKSMIDTHNSLLEGFNPIDELNKFYDYVYHVHVSENKLQNIYNDEFHKNFHNELKTLKYNKIITHEVLKNKEVDKSIKNFIKIYGK